MVATNWPGEKIIAPDKHGLITFSWSDCLFSYVINMVVNHLVGMELKTTKITMSQPQRSIFTYGRFQVLTFKIHGPFVSSRACCAVCT